MSTQFAVDGAMIKSLRERRGLSQQELATLTCLSVRQVKQIEDGGSSSFYNDDIKRKAMMKMVAVLDVVHDTAHALSSASEQSMELTKVRAEPLHELANPPVSLEENSSSIQDDEKAAKTESPGHSNSGHARSHAVDPDLAPEPEHKSNVLLWLTVVVTLSAVAYGLGLFPNF